MKTMTYEMISAWRPNPMVVDAPAQGTGASFGGFEMRTLLVLLIWRIRQVP